MWDAIVGFFKSLFGGKGATQIGSGNQAVSGSSTGDNSPVLTAGRDMHVSVASPSGSEEPPNAFAEQQEATVRSQIATLTRPELLALKQLVMCGQMTEQQLVSFCRQNGVEIVTPGILANKVTFLTRDFALGAWSVLPLMEPVARKVLSEVAA